MEHNTIISFWAWFRATIFGFLLGIFVTVALHNQNFLSGNAYSLAGFGIAIGYMQYRVLRKIHSIGKQWIWQSIFSVLVSCWIVDALRYTFNWDFRMESNVIIVKALLSSLGLGIAQALLLKRMKYNDWYIYAISNVAPLLFVSFTVFGLMAIQKMFIVNTSVLGLLSIITIIISYPMFNSLAFKYIQEQTFDDVELPEDKWDKWRRAMKEKEENQ